jgi:hypothetical protein
MKPTDLIGPEFFMLGISALNPGSPFFEIMRMHLPPHDGNDLRLTNAELSENTVKRSPVFPGHFHNPIYYIFRKGLHQQKFYLK